MDYKALGKQVTAIIPIYNEGSRSRAILDVMTRFPFAEVIVVNDGSTDTTADIVREYLQVRLIDLPVNGGKGAAMDRGVAESATEFVFFCDADVTGLNEKIIAGILEPVVSGEREMCIATRGRKMFVIHAFIEIWPLMGGERALTRQLWNQVPAEYKHRFSIEAALNFYAKYYSRGYTTRIFPELSHVMKEHKFGWLEGTRRRYVMLYEVIRAELLLQFTAVPAAVRNIRSTLRILTGSGLATLFGLCVMFAGWFGPSSLANLWLKHALQDDANPVIPKFLVWLTQIFSVTTIELIGIFLVVANLTVFGLQLKRLNTLLRTTKWTLRDILLKRSNPNDPLFISTEAE